MKSLKYLYKIGRGPSSSHTMGPDKAARYFRKRNPDADSYKVILYGSLSSTGKGHKTDEAILDVFEGCEIDLVFGSHETDTLPHENTMDFFAYKDGKETDFKRIMSVGGGQIVVEGDSEIEEEDIYPVNTFGQIAEYCNTHNIRLMNMSK